MLVEQAAKTKKKHGCLKGLVILIVLYGLCEGCSTYRNRPSSLYQRWLKTPVPDDVTGLTGNYKFFLTESVAWLRFKAPPERIAQIAKDRGLTLVNPEPHWSVPSDARTYSAGQSKGKGNWLWRSKKWAESIPPDQQIYWVEIHPDLTDFRGGWALYYSPSTREAYFVLQTI